MAEAWELVLHHTYAGTPGVIFDHSPSRRSHGQPVNLIDADFLTDGATTGSGAINFHSGTSMIRVPSSASWRPLGCDERSNALLQSTAQKMLSRRYQSAFATGSSVHDVPACVVSHYSRSAPRGLVEQFQARTL